MSQTVLTFNDDEFNHWRKAHLQKTQKHAPATKITVFPRAKHGPVAELLPGGQVKLRPQDETDLEQAPANIAWINYMPAWIDALKELAVLAGRQWGADWIQRTGEYKKRGDSDQEETTED